MTPNITSLCPNAECRILFIELPNVVLLNVVMLSVVVPSEQLVKAISEGFFLLLEPNLLTFFITISRKYWTRLKNIQITKTLAYSRQDLSRARTCVYTWTNFS
jgi:hypothetical protein